MKDGANSGESRWSEYSVDETGLVQITPDGSGKKYLWSDVQHVGIFTTEDGPFSEDVFFIIKTALGDICITQAQAEKIQLLKHFEQLPGFKWEQAVEAMSCTSERSFECWDRSWTQ